MSQVKDGIHLGSLFSAEVMVEYMECHCLQLISLSSNFSFGVTFSYFCI